MIALADTFNITSTGFVEGTIDGGDGDDTLVGANVVNTWPVTDVDTGNLTWAVTSGPRLSSILRQGAYLIASIHTALDDSQLLRFRQDLVQRIGRDRARGVVIDVAALDVLDSFASRTLRDMG